MCSKLRKRTRRSIAKHSIIDRNLELKVVYRHIEELIGNPRNPRVHPRKQIQKLAKLIRKFGFLFPILVDENGMIIAGHARVAAARLLGMVLVPVICVTHFNDEEIKALVIADNRMSELSEWDHDILAIEFTDLLDIGFDVYITGFDTPEIDLIIGDANLNDGELEQDQLPLLPEDAKVVSRVGDLLILGKNRILCGNALDESAYKTLMDGERAQQVISDPPYNVAVENNICGKGRIQHSEFVMASGELTSGAFLTFLATVLSLISGVVTDGAILHIFMDWRHQLELLRAADISGLIQKNLCVWNKTNAGMGTFYRSQHELVHVFKSGTAPHINNFELGQHGRHRSNVWTYAGINSFREDRLEELAMHPTVKPVAMIEDAIKDCSHRDGIILDPFVGSGTTIIAAEKTGRRGYAMELDPKYVDVAIRRWQSLTGKKAMHADTGLAFDELSEQRLGEARPAVRVRDRRRSGFGSA